MKNSEWVRSRRFGENMVLVEWPEGISEETTAAISFLQRQLEAAAIPGVLTCYPAYHTLAICFDPDMISYKDLCTQLESFQSDPSQVASRLWQIPVCYQASLGSDLSDFCAAVRLSPGEVIALHTATTYTVHFIGFLPGFPYLGGLDSRLHLPRKQIPARQVPAGSVAIGGGQTGIYPTSAPGGWHIIGRTPVSLFDVNHEPPCLLEVGDQVVFKSIDLEEYAQLSLVPGLTLQTSMT